MLPNFEERLRNEVTAIRPFQSKFTVWGACECLLVYPWQLAI